MCVRLDLCDQVLYCIYMISVIYMFCPLYDQYGLYTYDWLDHVIKVYIHVTQMIYTTCTWYNMICLICFVCSHLCSPYCLLTYDHFDQCVRGPTMLIMDDLSDLHVLYSLIYMICNVLVCILKIDLICMVKVCIHMITYVRSMWSRWVICMICMICMICRHMTDLICGFKICIHKTNMIYVI